MKARILAALAIVLGGALLFKATSAHAYEEWCFDDPVIQVGNTMVQTTVGVLGDPAYVRAHVKSATITYYLPQGVKHAKVLSTTTPYFAENVVFVTSSAKSSHDDLLTPISVSVSFNSDVSLPAQMINTVQSASKGPQKHADEGTPISAAFTTTSSGATAAGIIWSPTGSTLLPVSVPQAGSPSMPGNGHQPGNGHPSDNGQQSGDD